jgi:hypothetical protein
MDRQPLLISFEVENNEYETNPTPPIPAEIALGDFTTDPPTWIAREVGCLDIIPSNHSSIGHHRYDMTSLGLGVNNEE